MGEMRLSYGEIKLTPAKDNNIKPGRFYSSFYDFTLRFYL